MKRRLVLSALLIVVLAGTTRGSGTPEGAARIDVVPGAADLVGQVAGSELFIGIIGEQHRAVAYVVDGSRVGVWVYGKVVNGRATLGNTAGDAVSATLAAASATGTVRLAGGRDLRFTARPVSGKAGVYRLARRSTTQTATTHDLFGW